MDEETCLTWSKTNTQCCFATYAVVKPWIRIDLGAPLKVFAVIIAIPFISTTEVTELLEVLVAYEVMMYWLIIRYMVVSEVVVDDEGMRQWLLMR